ncbi:MAG TPA: DNA polymerase/3'-5' exonuclease PolX [Thermodesulfobacteriota bacterium]|nr:DNA polymerase/3'-5' exonuclease PolX [Thermodesulfobacteriota bacterium]
MNNQQISKIFNNMADLLDLKGENVFRVRAYRRAAESMGSLAKEVSLLAPDELGAIPGIGKDLAGKILEFIQTGEIAHYEALKREIPEGVLELLEIQGLGPKTAMRLFKEKNVKSIDELEALIQSGQLAGMPKIQKKTEENILKGLERRRRGTERRPLGQVLPAAEAIVRRIKENGAVDRILLAGSLRRRKDDVKDADILTTSRDPQRVMEVFVGMPQVERVLSRGLTKSSVILQDGLEVDLRVVEKDSFGAALQYFTGSKAHNIKLREMAVRAGLKINEYGIFTIAEEKRLGGREEEEIYAVLGLPFIPPELREDRGEIEAALDNRLPNLVKLEDIKGDLHVHSNWSDGSHDLISLVRGAEEKGYRYIAVTDHTKGLGVAHGLDEKRLREQIKAIDGANKKLRDLLILRGAEVDIRADGSLDLTDDILARLDIVIASVHSGFKQSESQMTGRILSAIRHPYVSIIGHPTGRIIGEREPYPVDMEAVLKEAAHYGVAMEINAYPFRLDLNDHFIKMAKDLGVPLAVNTDAHVISHFDFMSYGISNARRGWLEARDLLNTLETVPLRRKLKACTDRKKNGT